MYSQNYSRDNCIIYQVVLLASLGDFASWSWTSLWKLADIPTKTKISYKDIRYGSDDFSVIDHADNNLANGFLGFLVLAIILLLIAN